MTPSQRAQIWDIVQSFNIYLPAGPLAAHMERVKAHEGETWFAWIGGYGLGDPYYFRIHSPVVFCEVGVDRFQSWLRADCCFGLIQFDFHCGSEYLFLTIDDRYLILHSVFLTNTSPAKCHIHTINRLPNVGDYGKALIRQYHAEQSKK